MDAFEYFVVMSSLILGLGIAQILMGFSDLIAHYKSVKFSVTHTIYAIVIFIIHIQDWWYSYQYSIQVKEWILVLAILLLSFHIVLFLQARVLFPTGSRVQETDMVVYFGENWRLLYFLGAITVAISILQNIFISNIPLSETWQFFLFLGAYMVFIIFKIKNYYAHLSFVAILLAVWIIVIVTDEYVIH